MEVWKIIILSFHGWFAGSMLILQGVIFDTSTFTNGKASYLIESRPWSCSGGSWVCQCWRAFVACSPCWLRKSASPSTLLKAARCVWGNGHKIHAGFNRCCSQMIQQCLLHWVVVYCWYCMILFNFTYDMIWYDTIWYDMVRYGTIWYDMICIYCVHVWVSSLYSLSACVFDAESLSFTRDNTTNWRKFHHGWMPLAVSAVTHTSLDSSNLLEVTVSHPLPILLSCWFLSLCEVPLQKRGIHK